MWLLILGLGAAAWASFPFGKSHRRKKSRFPDTEKYVFLDMSDGEFRRFRKKDVRRYNKLERVAYSSYAHGGVSTPEVITALRQMTKLRTKYPDIDTAAYLRPKLNPRRKNGRKRRRSRRGRR